MTPSSQGICYSDCTYLHGIPNRGIHQWGQTKRLSLSLSLQKTFSQRFSTSLRFDWLTLVNQTGRKKYSPWRSRRAFSPLTLRVCPARCWIPTNRQALLISLLLFFFTTTKSRPRSGCCFHSRLSSLPGCRVPSILRYRLPLHLSLSIINNQFFIFVPFKGDRFRGLYFWGHQIWFTRCLCI